jgi:hypothetical protein
VAGGKVSSNRRPPSEQLGGALQTIIELLTRIHRQDELQDNAISGRRTVGNPSDTDSRYLKNSGP